MLPFPDPAAVPAPPPPPGRPPVIVMEPVRAVPSLLPFGPTPFPLVPLALPALALEEFPPPFEDAPVPAPAPIPAPGPVPGVAPVPAHAPASLPPPTADLPCE